MKNYTKKIFDWLRGWRTPIDSMSTAIDDEVSGVYAKKLHWTGMSIDKSVISCRDFYGRQKDDYTASILMDLARRYIDENEEFADKCDIFSYSRYEVIGSMSDKEVYDRLPVDFKAFDIEEALILTAQIVTSLVGNSALSQPPHPLGCAFFVANKNGKVSWVIGFSDIDGQPVVSMTTFSDREEESLWSSRSIVFCPLSVGEKNYLYSLES